MRVLWFADAQLPAVTGRQQAGGGWIEGLRRAIDEYAPEIELGVASPGPIEHDVFAAGNATYYHVPSAKFDGRVARALHRWRHDPAPAGGVSACVDVARAFSPDVVHFHGSEHYFGLAIAELAVPSVISLQGLATVCELVSANSLRKTGVMRQAASREFVRGDGIIHAHLMLRERAAMERRILPLCHDFMGRTEWDKTVVRLLRPEGRYHEVGEVLGEPFYSARWTPAPAGGDTLYCTGGKSTLKGVETLLEAVALLRRSGVRRPRLRVAGGTLTGLLSRPIHKLLEAPELRGAIDFLDILTPDQIAAELTRASVFVLPSHMDNSPNALCEAMLVGTPCIAAYVGGVPSLVEHGVDGLLYHDADPYALAGTIDRLLGDPELASRLGAAARQRAIARHSPKRVATQVVDAYQDISDRWRAR